MTNIIVDGLIDQLFDWVDVRVGAKLEHELEFQLKQRQHCARTFCISTSSALLHPPKLSWMGLTETTNCCRAMTLLMFCSEACSVPAAAAWTSFNELIAMLLKRKPSLT